MNAFIWLGTSWSCVGASWFWYMHMMRTDRGCRFSFCFFALCNDGFFNPFLVFSLFKKCFFCWQVFAIRSFAMRASASQTISFLEIAVVSAIHFSNGINTIEIVYIVHGTKTYSFQNVLVFVALYLHINLCAFVSWLFQCCNIFIVTFWECN